MIPKQFIEYYGDQTRWFLGTVVNNSDDPLQIGRVRVRIFGLHDGVEKDEDLPWAQIVIPTIYGVHEGTGQYLGMLTGTNVFGMFLDGPQSQLPLVVGTIPKENDNNQRATENYPYNKVYQTENGHFKEYDDTSENLRIREQHASGTYTEMQHDGSRETVVEKDEYIRVKGDVKIVGDLDATIEISGNCTVVIGGDATIEVAGSTLLDCPSTTVTGNLRVDGEVSVGGDVNTDAGISLNKHKHKILSGSSKGTSDKPV